MLFATYTPDDVASAEAFLSHCESNWDAGSGHRPWVMTMRDADDGPIGMLGVTRHSQPHAWEVGYILGRPWWGRGYVTEAVRVVVDLLFADPRVWRVTAPTHVDNAGSQRVLAKAGFSREATMRRYLRFPNLAEAPQDCSMWVITRDDREHAATVGPGG
jgi:RimJ/RimL family protein N-acetyltransferase